MLPTQTDVHIDFALTDMALYWTQQPNNFVADKVFSPLGVEHATNKYFTFNREDFFRDLGDSVMELGAGGQVVRGEFEMSNDSYSCDIRAIGYPVYQEIEKNQDGGVDIEKKAIDFVMQTLMVRREQHWTTKYFTTGVWTTDKTPANLWSDFSTSDPKADIETGKTTIGGNTGYEPNTLVVGRQVHQQLIQHPIIKDQFKYTSSESITEEMLAKYFEVDRYMVGRAVKATSLEGNTTLAIAYVLGKNALLCYSGPVSTEGPTAGRTFSWNGYGNDAGIAVQTYWEPQTRANVIEGFMAYDFKVVAKDLGYFFNGAVA